MELDEIELAFNDPTTPGQFTELQFENATQGELMLNFPKFVK